MAVELGIIPHEMFGRRAHSLALHSLDVSHCNLPSEIRIFAHVFEVAAIHRRAIDVEARPEHEVNSPGAGVSPYLDPFLLGKRGIPGGGQRNSACHYGRGWFGVAYPERTVGHSQPRQPELRIGANIKIVNASDHVDLLFEGHVAENRLNALLDVVCRRVGGMKGHDGQSQEKTVRATSAPIFGSDDLFVADSSLISTPLESGLLYFCESSVWLV